MKLIKDIEDNPFASPMIAEADDYTSKDFADAVEWYSRGDNCKTIVMAHGVIYDELKMLYLDSKSVHVLRHSGNATGFCFGSKERDGGGVFLYLAKSVNEINRAIDYSVVRKSLYGKSAILVGDLA